ncbi:hypothetical protein PAPYR_11970 [Paratrimastix pyriformis]|uniref:Uncharacterized protein n=1 Tax=Paratrimastix pyriformis TaxID=342808 RepID=A0ABQ8U2S2_9EUKA|nr:hypothetical protein PAPYR_11970 [Paratrimastix pyriformis]
MVPLIGTLSRNPEFDESPIPHDVEPEASEDEQEERVRKRTKAEERREEEMAFHEYMKVDTHKLKSSKPSNNSDHMFLLVSLTRQFFAKQNFIRASPQAFRELKPKSSIGVLM